MTSAKIMLKIDGEGRLHTDAETLARLKNQQFELYMAGDTVTLTPLPTEESAELNYRHLSDIEDVEERMRAYEAFKRRIMRPGGEHLPADWDTIRDSIYD